jgi:hypothetical protein
MAREALSAHNCVGAIEMKRMPTLLVFALTFGGGALALVGGCGASTGAAPPGGGDEGGSNGSTGTSGTSGSSGTSSSSGSSGDAGDAGDGGSSAGPGKVSCGAVVCDTQNSEACCIEGSDGGGRGCLTTPHCSGIREECEKSADCLTTGGSCCLGPSSGEGSPVGTAQCKPQCGADAKLCASDADCGEAGACVTKTCFLQQSFKVCGNPYWICR